MSRGSTLIFIGALVILSPFSGLPMSILSWVLPILGGLVAIVGASFRIRPVQIHQESISHEASSQNPS
ncbi:MAG: hypothetical protein JWN64_18 [Parcubacteria group bacterium]|nr:hypothetical protein [Parcubacteria group bacterium]